MTIDIWQWSQKGFLVASILVITFILTLLFGRLIKKYSEVNPAFRSISKVITFFVDLILYLIAFMVILDNLGVAVGPLLASLGITGLAISLALVDALKDIFSGIIILAEKNVKIGDKVRLTSGEEGEIREIGWRSIKLKNQAGEVVVIPNQKFYLSVVTVKR